MKFKGILAGMGKFFGFGSFKRDKKAPDSGRVSWMGVFKWQKSWGRRGEFPLFKGYLSEKLKYFLFGLIILLSLLLLIPNIEALRVHIGSVGGTTNNLRVTEINPSSFFNSSTYTGRLSLYEQTDTNFAPNITIPALTPPTVYTNTSLNGSVIIQDDNNDIMSVNFTWFVNGINTQEEVIGNLDNNTNITSQLDFGNFVKNDNVTLQAYVNDSTFLISNSNSSTITIANTNPMVTTPQLTPPTAFTNNTINGSVITQDIDNDNTAVNFTWYVNDIVVRSIVISSLSNNTNITDILAISNFNKSDNIILSVYSNDSSEISTIGNSSTLTISNAASTVRPPRITPTNVLNYTDINISTVIEDIDLDTLSVNFTLFVNDKVKYGIVISSLTNGTNITILINNGNYSKNDNITVQAFSNDGSLDSVFENSTIITISNSAPELDTPSISPPIPAPNVDINASVIIRDNDTSDSLSVNFTWFVNHTIKFSETISGLSNGTNITSIFNEGNFTRDDNITVQVYVNDSTDVSIFKNSTTITANNTPPTIPTLTEPINGTWYIYFRDLQFNWSNSTDSDSDSISYHFQLSNDINFDSFYKNITETNTNFTINGNDTDINVSLAYWRVRSFDEFNYSDFSSIFTLDIVYAKINISEPFDNTIFEIADTVNFIIQELDEFDWIVNATINVTGDGLDRQYTANNDSNLTRTNYTVNYGVPDISSTTLIVIAQGWNGTIGSSTAVNSTIKIKVTRPVTEAINDPNITILVTDPTYVEANLTVNITLEVDADVLLRDGNEGINTTLTYPNGTAQTLSAYAFSDGDTNNSFIYSYNYSFNATLIGQYDLEVKIRDLNYPTSSEITKNLTIFANVTSFVNLTCTGVDAISLKDVSSKRIIINGTNITASLVTGRYDAEILVSQHKIELFNLSVVSENKTLCTFDDIDETLSVPTNSRAVDQYEVTINGTYTNTNITYNYTKKLAAIAVEGNLELYKCDSQASCTFTKITTSQDVDLNSITASLTNFSVFMLAEDTAPSPVASAGGGGGGGRGGTDQIVAIDIISASPISLFQNDTIFAPIIITNNGDVTLFGITLSAVSATDDLLLSFSIDEITSLAVGAQVATELTIRALPNAEAIAHEITIKAQVRSPAFTDTVKFFIDLLEFGIGSKKIVLEKLVFLEKLLEGNPECLELQELIDQALVALDEKQYEKALSLSEAAIQACRELVNAQGKELRSPSQLSIDTIIVMVEIIAMLILFTMIYKYYQRKRREKSNET